MAKQFQHADKRNIPFAVIVEQEIASNFFSLKNLVSGEQVSLILGFKRMLL
jgi:histidyl-tRNA synthetase